MADQGEIAVADVTSEAFVQLAPPWAVLHASVRDATPFAHPEWHRVWLRHFRIELPASPIPRIPDSSSASPVFLSIRLGEQLVGVAALDLDGGAARELGDHNVRDYGGPLVLPGQEKAAAAGVVEWLMEDLTDRLDLWGVAAASPLRAAFAQAAAGFGWSFSEEPEAVCPSADLADDFETFVAGLAKHDRHELRRKLRILHSAGEVGFESATARADVEACFDRFLEMMRASRDDKDEFLTPAMEAFFRDLAATFADLGMVRLSTLTLDGQPTAMVLCFESASTTFLYNSGYDPAFAPLAVGLLSKAEAIRDAIARGKRTFDFLRGQEEYKKRLGGVPKQVYTLRLQQG